MSMAAAGEKIRVAFLPPSSQRLAVSPSLYLTSIAALSSIHTNTRIMVDEYTRFRFEGKVSIRPWSWEEHPDRYDVATILLVGPTGSGKSSFIEALSGDGASMGISSDQLEGFTKTLTPYELINAGFGNSYSTRDTICLVDTPGFSDSTISEFEIIDMVKKWMKTHQIEEINHIMYFSSITDKRLPGSRKTTMEMVKALIKLGRLEVLHKANEGSLSIITTMWDTLWTDRARSQAESHFTQLTDDIWKDFISDGTYIAKFHNTTSSAFQILDQSRTHWGVAYGDAFATRNDEHPLRETAYGRFLYRDLVDRITSGKEQKQALELELSLMGADAEESAKGNGSGADDEQGGYDDLTRLIRERLEESERTLKRFEEQLIEFGEPPEGLKVDSDKEGVSHK
ncbi:hypothetical protein CVT24_007632 [Panaeolus cyanescens]|uniref:G domain-containing protein n=1 Tax=Panaeolus cyanescens TaxID=181874 RepID=A0A409W564_9AGAR|nr:hypothetical protein CVT24_007632 [Panaeolus cyanescens]